MCDCLTWHHPVWALVGKRAGVGPGIVWSIFSALREADPILARLPVADRIRTLALGLGFRPAQVALVVASLQHSQIVDAELRVIGEWAQVMPVVMPSVGPPSSRRSQATARMQRWRTAVGLSPKEWAALRNGVLLRDGYCCVQCGGDESLHCDHIIELCDGGETVATNLQTLCRACHAQKTGLRHGAEIAQRRIKNRINTEQRDGHRDRAVIAVTDGDPMVTVGDDELLQRRRAVSRASSVRYRAKLRRLSAQAAEYPPTYPVTPGDAPIEEKEEDDLLRSQKEARAREWQPVEYLRKERWATGVMRRAGQMLSQDEAARLWSDIMLMRPDRSLKNWGLPRRANDRLDRLDNLLTDHDAPKLPLGGTQLIGVEGGRGPPPPVTGVTEQERLRRYHQRMG